VKLVFVSPAWRRHEVTRVALAQRQHLCEVLAGRGLEATCVVVGDDENLDVARETGFETVEQQNDPLGRKFNDGIEHACLEMGADWVVPIGSDDWVHPDLFEQLPDGEADPPQVLSGREIAGVNMETGMLRRCRVKGVSGTSPWVIPRQALQPSRFRPVNQKQVRGIDYSLLRGLATRVQLTFVDPHDVCRVDFKSRVNLNSYEGLTGLGYGPEEEAWPVLERHYPESLVDMARETAERMQLVAA
jgi:hypothetical protein